MSLASSRKGAAFEREFARSFGAKRTPLSGAAGGGDITPESSSAWRDWSWEGKRRAELPKFLTHALVQAASDIGVGDRRKPAVFLREDHGRTIVAFYWEDLRPWVDALAEVGRAQRVRDLGRELRRIAFELEAVK